MIKSMVTVRTHFELKYFKVIKMPNAENSLEMAAEK